ncbi:DUF4249 domain-containing protein [Spirosoma sp. KUDC1026]|uniref:DUF4249 domain-containing protein n=1 Tax=Spirosoma sp. KUDC1026 TaxID=2745947 RepID=UPI00159B8E09|nr:DUF4249 domain-containing protein [Spirosoma sp. KUDC1026]QKZ11786.1 DUF4249 domain-containing protein [Spirosoma sp. KUDC1026]
MKVFKLVTGLILVLTGISSCTTVIDATLDEGPSQLSVDGLITDQPGPQTIRLTQTAAYFNNSRPPIVSGATVVVADDRGNRYNFTDPDNDGYYIWSGSATDTLGHVGRTYSLSISFGSENYGASGRMNRVPTIDSLVFRKDNINPISNLEGYRAEFYANDLPGGMDYYRIRYFRNDTLQNKTRDIRTVQDAAFQGSADTDGLLFIRPLRQSVNPDSLYKLNDRVRVEIQSLTPDAFTFWQLLRTELGNGGLFATPPTNVPTNIINANPNGRKATGFFQVSAVRSRQARVIAQNIRPSE